MQASAVKDAEISELEDYAFDLYRLRQSAASFSSHHLTDPVVAVEFQLMRAHLQRMQAQIQEKDDTIASLKAELAKVGASTGEGSGGDVTMGEAMPEDGVTNEKETEPTVEEKLTSFFAPSSTTNVELRAAKRRIAELESQLEAIQEQRFLGAK